MTTNPMREQVIEAVARAMFKAALGADNFEKHDKPTRDYWLLKATAALTAVLDATEEPTEEMWVAGREPILMWQAGIQPSIKEAGPFAWYKEGDGETKGDCATWTWRAMHAALRRNLTEKEG